MIPWFLSTAALTSAACWPRHCCASPNTLRAGSSTQCYSSSLKKQWSASLRLRLYGLTVSEVVVDELQTV
eukprot:19642-Heterococcus_DN1.PRE.1